VHSPNAGLPAEDQIVAHVRYAPLAAASTLAAGALVVATLWSAVAHTTLVTWYLGLAVPLAVRVVLVAGFRASPGRWSATRWRTAFRATFVGHGLMWAVAAAALFVPGDIARQSLLAFAVGGIAASVLTSAPFDPVASSTFVLLASGPLWLRLLTSGVAETVQLGWMFGLFLGYLTLHGWRVHRQHLQNDSYRREAEDEATRRREAEARLRQVNQDLEGLAEARTHALRESEERFRAVFDRSPVALTLLDVRTRRFTEVNGAVLALFGLSREQALASSPADLGAWDDRDSAERVVTALERGDQVTNWEVTLRRVDGRRFPAVMHFRDVTIGGAPFRLAAIEDQTERRELEHRALMTQKMEVLGHLAGGVAHDFNNVLTVITSTAELALLDARPGDPTCDALQTIQRASTHAAQLTTRLLAFARRQVLNPTALNLNDVVGDLRAMVVGMAGEQVRVDVRTAASPVAVVADRASLDQILLNLAINALDAMPQGGTLSLVVGLTDVSEETRHGTALAPGRYATLLVRDTGHGMTDEVRQRIFEPFFTTKEVGKGTGLGLSMAYGVVSQSGGDITVESAPGHGTTFAVYLPATAPEAVRPATTPRAVARGHESVLVVDDDADILAMLTRALTHAGYRVLAAGGGPNALAILDTDAGEVDLLVTDVKMPGMDGRELADAVRARRPDIRVLFTSGYAENALSDHGVLAEGVHFIAKPFTLQALTDRIRHVLTS
jgi:PAS domain S-box-containing protein